MRSSFLSFAPDVSKEQCQAEHWIDIENVLESVKMTPEEIECTDFTDIWNGNA